MDPQEAIERPRFVIGDVVGLSPLPAPELMDTVHLENRVPKRVFTGLARKGHPVKPAPALFTRAGQAHALVFRDGMTPVALGIVAGLAASLASNRLLQSQLVGVSPFDPATIVSALLLLTVVALMACGVPARRAIRVNPVVALRQE